MGAVGLVILAGGCYLVAAEGCCRLATNQRAGDRCRTGPCGTIIIALLIGHSVVDYPLRTGALMAVFAFAAALTVPPPAALQDLEDGAKTETDARRDARSPGESSGRHSAPCASPDRSAWTGRSRRPSSCSTVGKKRGVARSVARSHREDRATLGDDPSVSSVSKPQWWTKQAVRSPSACNAVSRLYRCSQGH